MNLKQNSHYELHWTFKFNGQESRCKGTYPRRYLAEAFERILKGDDYCSDIELRFVKYDSIVVDEDFPRKFLAYQDDAVILH